MLSPPGFFELQLQNYYHQERHGATASLVNVENGYVQFGGGGASLTCSLGTDRALACYDGTNELILTASNGAEDPAYVIATTTDGTFPSK